ncbi:hypothetical protein E2C01_089966 [Portunus trituberculatus]|uniref:Uncharacterized protein n=1 Tax=Portunus trituberculatus TaxID=210409 RepID=A0A5B7JA83_PORTR|nr:hypothetical protein [Portunus trituberculatus]
MAQKKCTEAASSRGIPKESWCTGATTKLGREPSRETLPELPELRIHLRGRDRRGNPSNYFKLEKVRLENNTKSLKYVRQRSIQI